MKNFITILLLLVGINAFSAGVHIKIPAESGGGGTIVPVMTQGSIPFAQLDGSLTEDNTNLFWDDLSNLLGIGTSIPSEALDVVGNIAVSGNVDGRDVSTDGAAFDTHVSTSTDVHSQYGLLDDYKPTGVFSGCKVSVNTDTTKIDVSSCDYVIQGIEYSYAGATAIDPVFDTGEDTAFVYLNASGLQLRNTSGDLAEWSATHRQTQGTLARLTSATSGPSSVVSRIRNDRWHEQERSWRQRMFQVEAIGNVYASGGSVSESTTVFQLNQNSGILYDVDQYRHTLGSLTNVGGLKVIASGPTIIPSFPSMVVPKTYDNGAGGETALSTNSWASHTLLKSPKGADDDGAEGSFILVISSTSYGSQGAAQNAALEFGTFAGTQVVPVVRILVRGGSTQIEEFIDARPIIGTATQVSLSTNTLQDNYNNSATPEIVVDTTRGALTVRDAATPIGARLFEIEDNGGSSLFFGVDAGGATVGGNLEVSGHVYSTIPSTMIPTGVTQTVDWDSGSVQIIDLASATGNVTLTLSNLNAGSSVILKVIQGAVVRDIVWPAAVLWQGGTAPVISVANDAVDVIKLLYDGTNYYGNFGQAYQ